MLFLYLIMSNNTYIRREIFLLYTKIFLFFIKAEKGKENNANPENVLQHAIFGSPPRRGPCAISIELEG